MRKYLFIDLHMHSNYSYENDCDATPEDLLDNALTIVDKLRARLINRVNSTSENQLPDLIKELVPYFADEETKQDLLEKYILTSDNIRYVLRKLIKNQTQCTISITDHQNIQGSKEAIKLIADNPDKYKAINFITGIEVNAGLRCISENKDGYSLFKKCHALAYNYDINDPSFNTYSNLYNWKMDYDYNKIEHKDGRDRVVIKKIDLYIGRMVLLAKKEIRKYANIIIPMNDLEFLLQYDNIYEVKNQFLKYVTKKYKLNDKVKNIIRRDCFNFSPVGNENALNGGKWELDEYMQAIKNAGGQFSIAHPYSIQKKDSYQQERKIVYEFIDKLIEATNEPKFAVFKRLTLFDKTSIRENISAVNALTGKKYDYKEIYDFYVDYYYSHYMQYFVEKIISLRGDNDFGFEIFNKLNINGAKGKVLYDIAKKYDLYLTGGSDHHGPNLHPDNLMTKCFDKSFIYSDDNLFNLQTQQLEDMIDDALTTSFDNTLTCMPFLEFLKNPNYKCDRQSMLFYNNQNGTMSLNDNLFDRKHTWALKPGANVKKCKIKYTTEGITHIKRTDFHFAEKDLEKENLIDKIENKLKNKQLFNNLKQDNNDKITDKSIDNIEQFDEQNVDVQ